MKKHKTRYIILGIILLLVIFVIFRACGRASTASYTTETAATRDVTSYYSFTGNIAAKNAQQLVSGGTYQITKIYVNEGDNVTKGQTLYTLDITDLQNSLASAQASVQVAQDSYDNAQSPTNSQAYSQAQTALQQAQSAYQTALSNFNTAQSQYTAGSPELQQAQTALDSAKTQLDQAQANVTVASKSSSSSTGATQSALAQLNQAKAQLQSVQDQINSRTITAGIDGTVADIYAGANAPIKMGDQIMDIVDYSNLILNVKIDEYDIANIAVGNSVDVYIDSLNKDITGTVTKIANQATTNGDLSYFSTEISIPTEDDLRVGLTAEVRMIKSQNLGAVSVSMAAVQYDVDNSVYVLTGNKNNPTKQSVVVGANDGKVIAITSGLSDGDTVYVPKSTTSGNSGIGGGNNSGSNNSNSSGQ